MFVRIDDSDQFAQYRGVINISHCHVVGIELEPHEVESVLAQIDFFCFCVNVGKFDALRQAQIVFDIFLGENAVALLILDDNDTGHELSLLSIDRIQTQ